MVVYEIVSDPRLSYMAHIGNVCAFVVQHPGFSVVTDAGFMKRYCDAWLFFGKRVFDPPFFAKPPIMISSQKQFWRLFFAVFAGVSIPSGMVFSQTLEEAVDDSSGRVYATEAGYNENDDPYMEGEFEGQSAESHDGVDAAKSTLGINTFSRMSTTVEGPADISFWWKKDSQNGPDTLTFYTPDGALSEGLIDHDWKMRTVPIDHGTHDVYWEFKRDIEVSGLDFGEAWIDEVVVDPVPVNEAVKAAVEYTGPDLDMYTRDWTADTLSGALNDTVAKSGPVAEGETSYMTMLVEGPVVVEFDWGIESENSTARFIVDGVTLDSISDTFDLTSRVHELGPGTHTLRFEYTQEESEGGYSGKNEVYLDNLRITEFSASTLLAIAMERSLGVYSGPGSWDRKMDVSYDGVDSAGIVTDEPADSSRVYKMFVELPDDPGLLKFWVNIVNEGSTDTVSDGSGYLLVFVDGDTLVNFVSETDGWVEIQANLDQGEDRLLEAWYFRLADDDSEPVVRAAYIDQLSFAPGETNFQPDLMIQPPKRGIKGSNIHNASAAGQKGVARVKRRRPFGVYKLHCQNDSPTDADAIRLSGTKSNRHFKTFFVVSSGGSNFNYTASFVTGRFSTVDLSSGESESFEVWIRQKRRAKRSSRTVTVRGYSDEDSRKIDVVKAKLRVKKR